MKRQRTSRHAITSMNHVHDWILFVKEIDSRTPSARQVRSTATAKKRKSPPRAIVERMASALAHATFSKSGFLTKSAKMCWTSRSCITVSSPHSRPCSVWSLARVFVGSAAYSEASRMSSLR